MGDEQISERWNKEGKEDDVEEEEEEEQREEGKLSIFHITHE